MTSTPTMPILPTKEEAMCTLNIRDFPDDVHHEAKVSAVKKGESLKAWFIEAVKEKLAREKDSK